MPFKVRRKHVADVEAGTVVGNDGEEPKEDSSKQSATNHAHLNRCPSFRTWIRIVWPDILSLVLMGLAGLAIFQAPPAASRTFPVFDSSGSVLSPEFAYHHRPQIIPTWLSGVLSGSVPIAVITCMQIRVRAFWDLHNGIFGCLYGLATAAVFQVILKILIGGLRPKFLDICQPAVPPFGPQLGTGFANIMYDRTICTGDEKAIDDALESFPSGHATAAGASFTFLFLYLNAKLKVWSNYKPAYWKMVVVYMPVLGAVLICGSLTLDHSHNWYDILFGLTLGTVMGMSAYRMWYASIWDFRFNHIPLMPHVPFTYGNGLSAYDSFRDAVWTRQAGWGLSSTPV